MTTTATKGITILLLLLIIIEDFLEFTKEVSYIPSVRICWTLDSCSESEGKEGRSHGLLVYAALLEAYVIFPQCLLSSVLRRCQLTDRMAAGR